MKMNSKLNKDEDLENKITSNFAVIANESKTILTAIDELKKKIEKVEKVEKSKESEGTETIAESYEIFKTDLGDNIKRIEDAEKHLPYISPPRFQWTIAEIRDPVEEALKLFGNSPLEEEFSITWLNKLADKFGRVHSISGKRYVLETFNEQVIKNRKPGWSIKLHEYLQRYLLFPKDRERVIEEINSRDDLNAYVDKQNDILYVIAGGVGKYSRGVVSLFLVFLLGFTIPWLITSGKLLITMPKGVTYTYTELNILYILCWVGFAVHIIMKSRDVRKENPCLDDIVLWIHIKERGFLTSAVAVIAGYIVLLGMAQLTEVIAFMSGFAVDSFGSRIIRHYYSELEKAKKTFEKINLESNNIKE